MITLASGLLWTNKCNKSVVGSIAIASTLQRDIRRAKAEAFTVSRSAGRANTNVSSRWYVLIPTSAKALETLVVPVCPTLAIITLMPELVLDSAARLAGLEQAPGVGSETCRP